MSAEAVENVTAPEPKLWNLEKNTEYRFEVDTGSSIAIKLRKGSAEVFGAELADGKLYYFGHECKAAVYTWSGCTLEVFGTPSSEYVSEETPLVVYANLALMFEQMRLKAWKRARASPEVPGESSADPAIPNEPPRVLVIGSESSGKTSTCKILANYAVRTPAHWTPMLVNLDTSDGGCTVPGTISSFIVEDPIQTSSPANPLGSTATSGPSALASSALLPLVFWFGYAELRKKIMLMERLIRNLGSSTLERIEDDDKGRSAGLIVDTPANFAAAPASDKHKLLKACVQAFKINVILIIGNEKLNVEMQKLYGNDNSMIVMKIPKSGGVVEIDELYRDRVTNLQLRTYLYGQKLPPIPGLSVSGLGGEGSLNMTLSPHSSVINFNDLTIYRIGEESLAPQSALPIGAQRTLSETQPVQIDPSQPGSGLLNAVLALLSPPSLDESERYDEEVLDLDVTGFLVVTAIDMVGKKMTVLAPGPGSVAGRIALIGSFEWQEL